jgi:hypothetical protein
MPSLTIPVWYVWVWVWVLNMPQGRQQQRACCWRCGGALVLRVERVCLHVCAGLCVCMHAGWIGTVASGCAAPAEQPCAAMPRAATPGDSGQRVCPAGCRRCCAASARQRLLLRLEGRRRRPCSMPLATDCAPGIRAAAPLGLSPACRSRAIPKQLTSSVARWRAARVISLCTTIKHDRGARSNCSRPQLQRAG